MKFLLVDDHVLIRDALRDVLRSLRPEAVILDASRCEKAMQLIEGHPDIDLILLDLKLPDGSGLSFLSQVRAQHPSIGIVVFSAYHDRQTVEKALDLGALGFVPKSAERAVMLSAFQLIFSGGIYIPPEMLTGRSTSIPRQSETLDADHSIDALHLGLSERQLEVLALMVHGASNKAICRILKSKHPA